MMTTIIQNQPVEIHFNTSSEYDYRCFVEQFAIKLDLSDKSHLEYMNIKENLHYNLADIAVCVHGFRKQELIFIFKPEKAIGFFFNIHELENVLRDVVNSLKSAFQAEEKGATELLDSLLVEPVPYVLEVSITNIKEIND